MGDADVAHERSTVEHNPALDLFVVPHTDISYNGYRMVVINPTTTGIRENQDLAETTTISTRHRDLRQIQDHETKTCELFSSKNFKSYEVEWVKTSA